MGKRILKASGIYYTAWMQGNFHVSQLRTFPPVAKRERIVCFPFLPSPARHAIPAQPPLLPFLFLYLKCFIWWCPACFKLDEGVRQEEKNQKDLNKMKIGFLLGKMTDDGCRGRHYQFKPFCRCWEELFLDPTGYPCQSLGRTVPGEGWPTFPYPRWSRGIVGALWRPLEERSGGSRNGGCSKVEINTYLTP